MTESWIVLYPPQSERQDKKGELEAQGDPANIGISSVVLAQLDDAGRSAAGFDLQHFVEPSNMQPCTPVRQRIPPRAAAPSEEPRSAAEGTKGEAGSSTSGLAKALQF